MKNDETDTKFGKKIPDCCVERKKQTHNHLHKNYSVSASWWNFNFFTKSLIPENI